ncbi:unnamed protein product [Strongylus vulgaris]|uniref:THAP4-like heme-binding beta-barrel domain-containing protein n=1 Tax=Strongylus vulgaris TaxID=40348 RepID=A0A3P7KID5_STRVU|nr:unnamed protein product [Strongylus vulgaris]
MTFEEAEVGPKQVRFKLVRIGRISFSHDSAVRLMFREWTLLDEERFEARLLMSTTVTHQLMEHTRVIYKKIYP